MPKIIVDESLCTGCGLCASTCPEIFEVGDDGIAHVIGSNCASCDLKQVAEDCPTSAISIR